MKKNPLDILQVLHFKYLLTPYHIKKGKVVDYRWNVKRAKNRYKEYKNKMSS